jgi:hypothetical protein
MIGAIDCSTIHYASHAYLALYRSFCVFAPIKSYDQERAVTISLSISCVIYHVFLAHGTAAAPSIRADLVAQLHISRRGHTIRADR